MKPPQRERQRHSRYRQRYEYRQDAQAFGVPRKGSRLIRKEVASVRHCAVPLHSAGHTRQWKESHLGSLRLTFLSSAPSSPCRRTIGHLEGVPVCRVPSHCLCLWGWVLGGRWQERVYGLYWGAGCRQAVELCVLCSPDLLGRVKAGSEMFRFQPSHVHTCCVFDHLSSVRRHRGSYG